MKKLSIKILFVALFLSGAANTFAQENAKQSKPVVMILGTYHMGNPGLDLNNVKADDVRSEKRQKELVELMTILKKFKPTKIAVEFAPDEAKYLTRYERYLNGNYELAANEIDQIGFRLAKEMNHKRIYPIDRQGNFEFSKVVSALGFFFVAPASLFVSRTEREAFVWIVAAFAGIVMIALGLISVVLSIVAGGAFRREKSRRNSIGILTAGASVFAFPFVTIAGGILLWRITVARKIIFALR